MRNRKKMRKFKRKIKGKLVDCLDHADFILATVEGSAELDNGSVIRTGLAVSLRDLGNRIRKLGKKVRTADF